MCQHITLHSLITFHHASTRGSRAERLQIASLGAPQNSLSSTCPPIIPSSTPTLPDLLVHVPHLVAEPQSSHPPQFGQRKHAWLKECASLCPGNNCHPRVMSHLPLFTSSPIFPLASQTPTIPLEHDEHLGANERSHCDDLRQSGGFTQTVTSTGFQRPS